MNASVVIFASDKAWTIVPPGEAAPREIILAPDAPVDQALSGVVDALKEIEPAGGRLLLAIPSSWCLCAEISVGDLPRGNRRQAMLYRLEEKLPLAAEETVADFLGSDDERVLGVAGQVQKLQPVVETLEKAGWAVEAICPTALLAAQSILADADLPASDGLMLSIDGQLDLLMLREGRIVDWDVIPADADDLTMEIGLRALNHTPPLRIVAAGLPAEMVARLSAMPEVVVTELKSGDAPEAALATTRQMATGAVSPLVQLRRDALGTVDPYRPARKAINMALTAAAVFCVCLSGAMLWRASTYRAIAAEADRQQVEIYTQTFKGKQPPEDVNIASRMSAEERRLRALAGESLDVPSRTSALPLLQRLLAHIPQGGGCQVNDLQLSDERLYIEGSAPSHADAATFVAALAKDPVFKVEPPSTGQDASGVRMTVTGTINPSALPTTRQVNP